MRAPAGPAGFLRSRSCRGGSLQRAEHAAAVGGQLAETLVVRVLAVRSCLWFLTNFARWQYLARSGDISVVITGRKVLLAPMGKRRDAAKTSCRGHRTGCLPLRQFPAPSVSSGEIEKL